MNSSTLLRAVAVLFFGFGIFAFSAFAYTSYTVRSEMRRVSEEASVGIAASFARNSPQERGHFSDALRGEHAALRNTLSLPGEAHRNNEALSVVLVNFAGDVPALDTPFLPVTLDLAGIGSSGVVLVTEEPLYWRVTGTDIMQRAKVGIESLAPARVGGAHRGLLAALRIRDLDTRHAIGPESLDSNKPAFCTSMKYWSDVFSRTEDRIGIWRVQLDRAFPVLAFTGGAPDPGGATRKRLGDAEALCGWKGRR